MSAFEQTCLTLKAFDQLNQADQQQILWSSACLLESPNLDEVERSLRGQLRGRAIAHSQEK